jgi:hypothetical protein
MRWRYSATAAMCGFLSVASLGAQRPPTSSVPPAAESLAATTNYRARWLGVYDQLTGEPIEGVRVLDLSTGNSTLTSVLGAVNLIYLADGANLVSMQKIGYEQIRMAIAIGPRDTVPLTVLMRRITELPKVVTTSEVQSTHISPYLRGFDERRRNAATGYFITDSILRRDESRPLANILQAHAPNAVVQHTGRLGDLLLGSPSCTWGEAPPQVYLDGVPLAPPMASPSSRPNNAAQPFDLSQFNVSELGAIEWYPDNSRTPVEFAHTSTRCGALLLWTRER